MKRILTFLMVLILPTMLFAGISSEKTNLPVMDNGKGLYGDNTAGWPKHCIGVNTSGAVEIDADGVGITFSGDITTSKDVTFSSPVTLKPVITIKNTNADANSADLVFQKDSASPADNDILGNIKAVGWDSEAPTTENSTTYVQEVYTMTDETDATEDGLKTIDVITGGAAKEYIGIGNSQIKLNEDSADIDFIWESDGTDNAFVLDAGADTFTYEGSAVFNEASADKDFRVETDGNANMLFVDGGDNAVGIGKDPSSGVELDVAGDIANTGYVASDLPSVSSLVTANAVTPSSLIVRVQGTDNAIDLSSDPQITDGVAGQLLILVGEDDTNTVTFDDGTGLQTAAGGSRTLGDGDILMLYYDDDADIWREISYSDN